MEKSVKNLEKQATAKKAYETKLESNALTKYLPDASDVFKSTLPTDIGRLSYYAREIDLNIDKSNWTSARSNYDSAMKIWTGLKVKISSAYSKDISTFNMTLKDLSKAITDKNSSTVKSNVKKMLDEINVLKLDLDKQYKIK